MPRIRLSTETIHPVSQPNFRLSHDWISGVRALREGAHIRDRAVKEGLRAVDTAIAGAARINDMVERKAERDADEAETVWETSMLAGLKGTVGQDGKRHGGILQKTWTDYEDGKTSPITDMGEIEKNFQSSDTYKNLSGLAREKFNKRVMTRRARYLAAANQQFDKNALARTAFYDKQADDLGAHKIESAVYLDDASFENVCREETFKKQGRKFRNLMENPEILDRPDANPDQIKWKDPKAEIFFKGAILTENRNNAIGRVAVLAKNAAASEITWSPDGKLVVNDAQLKAAEEYTKKLANPYVSEDGTKLPARISPEEAKALGYKCLQARSKLDRRVSEELAAESANALAKGDLASLEAAEKKFQNAADSFKDNKQRETSALIARNKVAEAADKRATTELMGRIASGESMAMIVKGPDGKQTTTSIFDPKTQARYARCYPKALEEMGKLQKNGKSNNDTELRYAEAALDYLEADGLHSDKDIERAKRLVYEKGDILAKSRALTPEDAESFRNRWAKRNTKEEAKAAVEFDRAFGVSFDLKPDETTSKDVSTIEKHPSEYNPKYPGTGESVNLKKYMKMRSAFIERLRALPPDANRVKETRALISEFKAGWFKDRTAENIEEMVTRMTEINNEAASRIAAERLREAEAQRIRNLPVVSMERPENKEPMENPLDFYNVLGAQSLQQ